MSIRATTLAIAAATLALTGCWPIARQTNATPPPQPADGPGGANTKYASVKRQSFGSGATAYTIFVPQNPTPAEAPVVIFTHGWGGTEPSIYGAWIDHIVRHEGAIVIFPVYQEKGATRPNQILPNAVAAVKDAMTHLRAGDLGVKPQEDKAAYVGHSAGGLLAANLAADAKSNGLPMPKAVMCVEPGGNGGSSATLIPLEDLSQIPAGTLLIALSGDKDQLAGNTDAKKIFAKSTHVAAADKNYVVLSSDDHGSPALTANHLAPIAPEPSAGVPASLPATGPIRERLRQRMQQRTVTPTASQTDALDFYGTWKLFDGLCDAAFYGKNREYALGNTPQQKFMGIWSDGVPVKPIAVKG